MTAELNRLNCQNFFYYMTHCSHGTLDPKDRTTCKVLSIALFFFTAGIVHLLSLLFSSCCLCGRITKERQDKSTPPPTTPPNSGDRCGGDGGPAGGSRKNSNEDVQTLGSAHAFFYNDDE
jgi:hypothetical protein